MQSSETLRKIRRFLSVFSDQIRCVHFQNMMNSKYCSHSDNNRNDKLEIVGTPRVEMAGVNIHRATAIKGGKSVLVDKWSAACMVWASESDFANFMNLIKTSMKTYGPIFSMALFNSKEFFNES